MTALEEFNDLLARSGVSLGPVNPSDTALPRSTALRAIEILRRSRCPILGGDVWLRRDDRFAPGYANWYADPKPAEDPEAYLLRCWDTSEAYIKNFPESADAEVLFVFVLGAAPVGGISRTDGTVDSLLLDPATGIELEKAFTK